MQKARGQRGRRFSECSPLRSHQQRLAAHQGCRTIAHRTPGDKSAFDHQFRLDPEKCRPPDHDVSQLSVLKRSNMTGDSERARGIDRIFSNIAENPSVVAEACAVLWQGATL